MKKTKMTQNGKYLVLLMTFLLWGCQKPAEQVVAAQEPAPVEEPAPTEPETPAPPKRYLYVASGACYGGGVTLSVGSGTVVRYNLETGAFDGVVVDYNTYQPGDLPAAIVDYSATQILVAVENTSGRRIDLVNKNGSGLTTYIVNSTALGAVLRDMDLASDGSLLVSRSTAVEKFSSGKARITQGANAYIQAPGSSCATSATLISAVTLLGNSNIAFTHAAASPNNKIGIISTNGYAATSDCLATQAAPTTTALPTAAIAHSSGDLLVAYGSTTAASNFVYAYDVDPSTNIISNATASVNNMSVVYGPSAMIEDKESGNVYVANSLNTFNNVEKFTYSDSTKVLTRVGTLPFIPQSVYTRCVAGLSIGQ